MPSIVSIMINTIFGFGQVTEAEKERNNAYYVGSSVDEEYTIGFTLVVLVLLLIPVFLCVKPCCFREKAKVNPRDALLEANGLTSINPDDLEGDEDKKLIKFQDQQLRQFEPKNKDETFGDAMMH
jgi:hypothetical protein